MSDIETSCPYCNSLFSVDEAYAGQNLPCPNCGNTFQVACLPPPVQIAQPMRQPAAPMYPPAQMMPQMPPQPVQMVQPMRQPVAPMYQPAQMMPQQMPVQQPMYPSTPIMPPPGGGMMGGQPYVPPQAAYGYEPKERLIYILLGLFLGSLGVHNFYAGYTGKAVAQLLITLLSLGTGSIIVSIWVIVEVCTVRTDARGIPFA